MTSPMMQQFYAAKKEQPEGLLFFRMGDFFELFGDDAVKASELLGLTLTSRDKGPNAIPMAGMPVRSTEAYIHRLVRMGLKVVVCDQLQSPAEAKGIVERGITRVVTPGTVIEEESLEEKENNFLCSVYFDGATAGIAWADVSTGTFLVQELAVEEAMDGVLQVDPAECLLPESALDADSPYAALRESIERPLSTLADWRFELDAATRNLCEQFRVSTLAGFGVAECGPALCAAGAVLAYLKETQRGSLSHLTRIRLLSREAHMRLDRTTRTSLELIKTLRDGERKGTLLWVLDRTHTPMGARLLKSWVLEPLRDVAAIHQRQDSVAELYEETTLRDDLRDALKQVQDIDRLLARVACGRASARELVGLRQSLSRLPAITALLSDDKVWSEKLRELRGRLPDLSELADLLERALQDEVPLTVKEGGLIREGFDPGLDDLRSVGSENKQWIANFQSAEQERTGIPTLKVGFNRVFGYYIEITHAQAARAPEEYIRKQTLKNAERYITPELKEYEEKALGAEEKIKQREYEHFLSLRDATADRLTDIQLASEVLAEIDVLQSMAEVARENRYVRPIVDDSGDIDIKEGRHPVLDQMLKETPFVPNDLEFRRGTRELLVITGPNMAGKSTFIRQAALLTIMAQTGSFVPAESATIGIVDRVFTRVGASDELQKGNSTFMVEMIETAEILNDATEHSLVILDEVGRGTSTFDGLAIAWAITEHLGKQVRARTLFATHYHQLLDLATELPNAANLNVAVREWGEEIVFLHKIIEGGTDRSYGIHVARLAGLPRPVLGRAEEILKALEKEAPPAAPVPDSSEGEAPPPAPTSGQLSLFAEPNEPLARELGALDLDNTTPIEALMHLKRLRDLC